MSSTKFFELNLSPLSHGSVDIDEVAGGTAVSQGTNLGADDVFEASTGPYSVFTNGF